MRQGDVRIGQLPFNTLDKIHSGKLEDNSEFAGCRNQTNIISTCERYR